MPLQSYVKAPVTAIDDLDRQYLVLKNPPKRKLSLWDILFGFINDVQSLFVNSKFIGAAIPLALILSGFVMIYQQFWPDFEEYIKLQVNYYDNTTVALASEDYIDPAQYLSNPGADYFRNLSENAKQAQQILPDPVSNEYSGQFALSIPSIGVNDLKVTANVDSGVEASYDQDLLGGLAHFGGTGLPISPVDNNIVIYGHSSSGNYYDRTGDPAAAFTVLNEVKIGDEIVIEMEGETYKYKVKRSKIVQPNDLSIVTGEVNKETLTLFTCYPPGNSAQRFVVTADVI